MSNRVSASDRDNRMNKLISPKPGPVSPSKATTPESKPKDNMSQSELKRQTYYLSLELIEALRVMSFKTGIDKSELVRKLLSKSELKAYIDTSTKL